ncbi:MAG: hypothetical protein KatS3mg103_1078 [Phycisphaerales bacterium]|nr:MAG: hypothetical protein KatS3mg103_1078 [Phycisphaerales bacterium]
MEASADNPQLAPTLLLIEQLPELVATQVKAISSLKIDEITVWDSGRAAGSVEGKGGVRGTTSDFLAGLIGALPPVHELARQAGVQLPQALGAIDDPGGPRPAPSDRPDEPKHAKGTSGDQASAKPGAKPDPGSDTAGSA